MNIDYRKANKEDAERLVEIYNSAFYDDFIRYGECPAYGRTKEMMEQSIIDYPKFLIIYEGDAVGCISCRELDRGTYEVGCLCVIPEYQGRGIGTAAMNFAKSYYSDWKKFTLVTPIDKTENVRFYTEKCGFMIQSEEMDGNVRVVRFILEHVEYKIATGDDMDLMMSSRLEMLRVVNDLDDTYVYSDEMIENSRKYFADGDQTTVLAMDGKRVIGCASLSYIYIMPTFSHPTGKRAHLMNVYTMKEWQRRGIAKKMCSMLIEEAWKRGVTEISLDATEEGRPLYYKLGFTDTSEGMVLVKP